MKQDLLALVYAAIGGFVGYLAVPWIWTQGFYAMMLPGGLLGLGAGFSKSRSLPVAILCGISGTVLGYYTEWRNFPFAEDASLEFFVQNLGDLRPITHIMIALGGFLGFWVPYRNIGVHRSQLL